MGGSMAGAIGDDERRREPRRRVLLGGRLSFNSGFGVIECVVRDRSGDGAKLAFGDAAGVPPVFDLQISTTGETRTATVRWRRGDQVGVALA
jgi:hypothetical protein